MTTLVCHDNDDAGRAMFNKWRDAVYTDTEEPSFVFKRLYATPVPEEMGKDIGEAVQKGLDLRKWVLETLETLQLR